MPYRQSGSVSPIRSRYISVTSLFGARVIRSSGMVISLRITGSFGCPSQLLVQENHEIAQRRIKRKIMDFVIISLIYFIVNKSIDKQSTVN